MTSRERVRKALNFEEADRVPLDLGGTIMSGIMAQAYARLRQHLGIGGDPPRVYEIFQMLAEVEMSVLEELNCDVVPLDPLKGFFDIKRERWKPWTLFDGTEVLTPGDFNPVVDERGDIYISPGGDNTKPPQGKMPKDGFYFDVIGGTDSTPDFELPKVEDYEPPLGLGDLGDEELDYLKTRAEKLHQETDYSIVWGYWGGGLNGVGSFADWMCTLLTEKQYVHELFDHQCELCIKILQKYAEALGDYVDVIGVSGNDLGTQRCELMNPDLFHELYVPYYKRINDWVHEHTNMKTFFHSCGSIYNIMEALIECGVDIINPVQCSAENMASERLKEEFGGRIVFWGGGVDTQKTLPFGTPEEVRGEVAERVKVLGPGGGFIFNPVHNIQHGTPAENIVSAYRTAYEVGSELCGG